MTDDGEARLTFDTKPFMDGLKKIGEGFSRTFDMAKKVGNFIEKALTLPIAAVKKFSGFIQKALAPLAKLFSPAINAAKNFAGGILSINGAMKAMPIVGQTFEFIGDVIRRNLFAPLQRELLPLLQKLIKWVMNNRPLFVKWGAVIANVFRGVYQAAKAVWEIFKSIFDMIGKALSKTFGGAFKDIDEIVNTIVWKVVMIMLFLTESFKKAQDKFQPLITAIVDFVTKAGLEFLTFGVKMYEAWQKGDNFEKLVRGVEAALKGIDSVISSVVTGVGNLITQLLLPDVNGNTFGDVVESMGGLVEVVGDLFGSSIAEFFESFNAAVGNISSTLKGIMDKLRELVGVINDTGIVQAAFRSLGYLLGNAIMIILVGIQVALNNIVSTFKMIGVLGDSELSWTDKFKKMNEINEERMAYNNAAWDNVQVVKQVKTGVEKLFEQSTEVTRERSIQAITAQETMEAIKSGELAETLGLDKKDGDEAEAIFGKATGGMNLGENYGSDFKILLENAARQYKNYPEYGDFLKHFKDEMNTAYNGKSGYQVQDAIITKSGQVIRTAPDDNIYAFKSLGGKPKAARSTETRIQFGDVHITVSGGATPADARRLGQSAAMGFSERIAQELSYTLLREGV